MLRAAPLCLLLVACAGRPPAPASPAAPPPPPPPPECGTVDVDDASIPPDPERVAFVRHVMRQKLFAQRSCDKPYHVHADLKLDSPGLGKIRAKLTLVVYGKSGIAGTAPVKVSGDGASIADTGAVHEVLRMAAERGAELYGQSFH